MIGQCFVSFLLALPLFAAADPLDAGRLSKSSKESAVLGMFSDFALTYNKHYASPEEFSKRFSIFKQNLQEIERLNEEHKGMATFGVNKFADLTYDEFVAKYTGGKIPSELMKSHVDAIEKGPREEIVFTEDLDALDEDEDQESYKVSDGKVYLPKRIDYRKRKAVTPVKNQGQCGSCWAFSAVANIEGIHAKKTKKLFNLAEQVLLDCDNVDGACDGGWMTNAINELIKLGGIMNATDYPYTAHKDSCRFEKNKIAVKVKGNKELPQDEKEIAKELVKSGPLSVAIQASSAFIFYKNGVFDPTASQCSKDSEDVNHGVVLVGYGVFKKTPFWTIKNSWGPGWGDKGYIRISRNKRTCAVHSFASTAVL